MRTTWGSKMRGISCGRFGVGRTASMMGGRRGGGLIDERSFM
jgi:hypothetical protein